MNDRHIRSEWVTVAVANRLSEAYMIKAMLEEAEILVFLKDEMTAQSYSNPLGGINVQVPYRDAEMAYKLIAESGYAQ